MTQMKTNELREKSVDELHELLRQNAGELFQARLQNYTNQLDDTSSIPKHRKDIARIQSELRRRELESLAASVKAALEAQGKAAASADTSVEKTEKKEAPKAEAAAPATEEKPAKAKAAKKSEASDEEAAAKPKKTAAKKTEKKEK